MISLINMQGMTTQAFYQAKISNKQRRTDLFAVYLLSTFCTEITVINYCSFLVFWCVKTDDSDWSHRVRSRSIDKKSFLNFWAHVIQKSIRINHEKMG